VVTRGSNDRLFGVKRRNIQKRTSIGLEKKAVQRRGSKEGEVKRGKGKRLT
jgi:hypothetical protein